MNKEQLEQIKKDLEAGKLTPEQLEQLRTAYLGIVDASVKIFEAMFAAMQPVIKTISQIYESLPDDMKRELAEKQVNDKLKSKKGQS